ncbi:MAG: 3'-5' exonuclease domain-containing protein 2 [Bacteroidaceae bacterium]|nr:3'-5' exonuclease domain-containing protein 2 [Bacteroidaceae bacterium]
MIIKNKITKEEINEMPKVEYQGQIYIIDTPQQADFAVRYLSQFPLLGIDTETRPSFKKGVSHKVALFQVATNERCYLFRLNVFGLTLPLIQLLENPHIAKVGTSLKDDFLQLRKWAPFEPKNIIELQALVQDIGINDKSLQKIYANLFGSKISKSQRLSNWEAEELSISQQHYAAIDAWACIQIYRKVEELKETGDYELIIVPEPEPESAPAEEKDEETTNLSI